MKTLSFFAVFFFVSNAFAQSGSDVPSVFHISKSQNRNQVHFGIHLDAACRPVGSSPVYAYWRVLEESPTRTEPLDSRATRVYGIASQSVSGATTTVELRSLPSRAVTITARRRGSTCAATATMTIDGQRATLNEAFVQLRALDLGVRYVEMRGTASGRAVTEQVTP